LSRQVVAFEIEGEQAVIRPSPEAHAQVLPAEQQDSYCCARLRQIDWPPDGKLHVKSPGKYPIFI
jgi:hypothetical protein